MRKLEFNTLKNCRYHLIGCGGAGMAPLGMIMRELGSAVSGSDLVGNSKTMELCQAGADVHIGHSSLNLPGEPAVVVRSSAVKDSNPELAAARKRGWECISRGEMLARLASTYDRTVSISGSHGKTTVATMLAHIMRSRNVDAGYMIGGKPVGMPAQRAGDGDIFICEVDESDGSHTLIDSHLGIITNVDDDHCWSVGGEERLMANFKTYAAKAPKIIYTDSPRARNVFHDNPDKVVIKPDEVLSVGYFEGLDSGLFNSWGDYQLINAALAVEAAVELGVTFEDAVEALNTFGGVDRRMTEHYSSQEFTLIEDYAHHPEEVRAALNALRKRFPGRELCVLFQPHRQARLERYLEEFAETLAIADKVMIVPVFAAWTDVGTITPQSLADDIGPRGKFLDSNDWKRIAPYALKQCGRPGVLVVLGAGDIDAVVPEMLKSLKADG